MHAVVVRVAIQDVAAADQTLKEQVVPRVKQAPGFVAGYWTRKDESGLAMIVFDSEDSASRMREMVPSMIPDTVTLQDVEVREVVVNA